MKHNKFWYQKHDAPDDVDADHAGIGTQTKNFPSFIFWGQNPNGTEPSLAEVSLYRDFARNVVSLLHWQQ